MRSACVSLSPSLSVTFTVKLNAPAALGVPEIVPAVASSVSPPGSAPAVIVQANGFFPPAVERVWSYAVPTVALGSTDVLITTGAAPTA